MPEKPLVENPNIILIVLDAVRANHLSCYGYHRPTSPNLERIATRGQLFLKAISAAPGTLSSMPSILTGLYVSEHGVGPLNRWLDEGLTTLGEWLQRQGYLTAGFSNNAWVSDATGLSRGFSTFKQVSRLFSHRQAPSSVHAWAERAYRLFVSERRDSGDRDIVNKGLNWVYTASKANSPFFLFLHLLEAHSPYDPPNPYYGMFLPQEVRPRRRSWTKRVIRRIRDSAGAFHAVPQTELERQEIVALYDASIRYLDDLVGGLYARLESLGLLENTLLIITADHGENLGDHGLLGHGGCLYETLIHVPLLCVNAKLFSPSRQEASLVQGHDIFPTIVDILGGDDQLGFDSARRSLLPDRVRSYPRAAVFSEDPLYGAEHLINTGLDPSTYNRALAALRTHEWKYIQGTDGAEDLYDLRNDPGETNNLASVAKQQLLESRETLEMWKRDLRVVAKQAQQVDLDQVLVERLRSLGYIA